jgi:hypothetical protein
VAIKSETELYAPVKSLFEGLGYEVKSEVNGCDLIALREEETEPVIVELKKTFNLPLLFQGIHRLKLSSTVYLAVEHIKGKKKPQLQKWKDICLLCEKLGLGLITVQFYKTKKPHVEILCSPIPSSNDARKLKPKKKTLRLIDEFRERSGDYNVGGSTQQKLVTAYRELALQCAYYIHLHGSMSPLRLRELTGKQKVSGILQKNYYGWFERVERGIYQLTSDGEEALKTYSSVVEIKQKKQPD